MGKPTRDLALAELEARAAGQAPAFEAAADAEARMTTFCPIGDLAVTTKENNPKDGFGILKASLSWVSMPVVMEMAVGMAEGGFKYGGHNYRVCAPRASVYVDGAIRHIVDWWEGEDNDSDAQIEINNISKAITSLCVLRDAMIQGNYIDDRPPPSPKGWLKALGEKMKTLAAKNPEPVARYLANGKRGPGRILPSA